MKNCKYIIYHVGARDNYLLSEILTKKNKSFFLVTDFWIRDNSFLNKLNSKFSRRFSKKIKSENIIAFNFLQFIYYNICLKFYKDKFSLWNFMGSFFQKFLLQKLRIVSNENYVFFGYTGGNFKVLEKLKKNENIFFIHNQFDPGLVYYDLENSPNNEYKNLFLSNIQKEWELSNLILVNSEYSHKCLVEKGVSYNKIKVVPLAYNKPIFVFDKQNNEKLKIAFVGNISKIKGFEIFYEVAKQVHNDFEFIAVGNSYLNDKFIVKAKKYISFLGFLSKDEIETFYKDIDVLIFPTLCDGFGMVQLEAMANGIPVIASEYCAKIVIENENGYITNEPHEIISKLNFLNQNRILLSEMSKKCFETAQKYNEENYLFYLNKALNEFNLEI